MSGRTHESLNQEVSQQLAYEWSLAVALATEAVPNYCYANVWHAITELVELSEALLVEGWVVTEQESQVLLIEHCWCERTNSIIDPSLVLLMRCGQPVRYFSGIQRNLPEVRTLVCKQLPRVCSIGTYGRDGMKNTDYRAAYQAAYRYASSLVSTGDSMKQLIVQPSIFPTTEVKHPELVVQIVSSQSFLRGSNERIEL